MAAELRKRSITIVVVACRAGGAADSVAVAILVTILVVESPPKAALFPLLAQNHFGRQPRE